jgi:hypothetical protein
LPKLTHKQECKAPTPMREGDAFWGNLITSVTYSAH